jgi:alpha-N-arabinofuranosidase
MTIYRNPVVRGTEPDPSVVRVGQDFFLATSSFSNMPGILIRHSTNLLDWEIIGGAITRPAQYRRDGRPGPISLFAPTLRHHDGTFYLACTNVAGDQGHFIVRTEDPAGAWSDALWLDREAFDPSLFRDDDGTWLYTRRSMQPLPDGRLGPIVQAEIDIDSGRLGPFQELTPGHAGYVSNDIEGPHLYKIDGWYYLFSAEGGTWTGHMETCARSRSPWGPFEPAPRNPVLTHRNRVGHPIQSIGHADLVDDVNGNWWALFLGTRHAGNNGFVVHHNLGRETFLAPVEWEDGWPVIGEGGTVELEMFTDRTLPDGRAYPGRRDTLWTRGWRSIGLTAGAAALPGTGVELMPGDTLDSTEGPVGALLIPQREDVEVFEADLETTGGSHAGVAVYTDAAHHFSALVGPAHENSWHVEFARRVDDVATRDVVHVDGLPRTLRILATEDRYVFEIDTDRETVFVGTGRARLLSAEAAEWFVGTSFALVSVGPGGTARFSAVRRDAERSEALETPAHLVSHLTAP